MRSSEIVIYTDNGNAPVSKLVGTACTIGIQSFISNARFDASGKCTLEMDWPLESSLKNGDIPVAKEGGKRKILVALGGEIFTSRVWQACSENMGGFVEALIDFIKDNQFDGIDIDWEDSEALTARNYDAVAFLSDLTLALRARLPAPDYIITHAPQAPYLDKAWQGGPYLEVMKRAGSALDYLNIQYYNNPWWVGDSGSEQAAKVAGTTGSPAFATSIVGLVEQGLPVEKLLVGKPTTAQNAGSGFLDTPDLCHDVIAPLVQKYGSKFGGVMGWQLAESPSSPDLALDWIASVARTLD
jgi:chitinase